MVIFGSAPQAPSVTVKEVPRHTAWRHTVAGTLHPELNPECDQCHASRKAAVEDNPWDGYKFIQILVCLDRISRQKRSLAGRMDLSKPRADAHPRDLRSAWVG